MVDDDNPRRRYSLSGGTSKPAAPAPSPKAPAAPAKPVNTSTFLTRIANSAIRESTASSGGQSGAGNPRWMQIDHSSPAANLNSRLRWVENAFKEQPQAPVQTRTQVQHAPVQQAPAQQQNPASPPQVSQTPEVKAAIGVLRKRFAAICEQITAMDCELAEIEKRLH